MALQAYIDDSYDQDGIFVLGGCVATVESWAAFSAEWEKMLPYTKLINKKGKPYFKMSTLAQSEEGMAIVPAFFRIIEKHVSAFVSVKIDKRELRRARSRLVVPSTKIDWGDYAEPYYIAFRCLIDQFHLSRKEQLKPIFSDEKIDFYFDDQTEKKTIISIWTEYMENRPPDVKDYYGATPRFESDDDFLPLQAADCWAWWVRIWYKKGRKDKKMKPDFAGYKEHPVISIVVNEDALVDNLKKSLRILVGPERLIYDTKFFFA